MTDAGELRRFELELAGGAGPVCGVDEAGRGPLAGPVCCAAVVFGNRPVPDGINDSKKLSPKKRLELYGRILEAADSCAVVFVWPETIDEINILEATMAGMREAVMKLTVKPGIVLIDGNRDPGIPGIPSRTVTGGDAKAASIAAASILAKVTRDRLMDGYALEFPGYAFERNKGYGTREHYAAIKEKGISPIHRRSFLKNI
ncbi:MAG: ribonuclease HII [Oscillospiraceae bacterium]|jgi:ribonuclease HII